MCLVFLWLWLIVNIRLHFVHFDFNYGSTIKSTFITFFYIQMLGNNLHNPIPQCFDYLIKLLLSTFPHLISTYLKTHYRGFDKRWNTHSQFMQLNQCPKWVSELNKQGCLRNWVKYTWGQGTGTFVYVIGPINIYGKGVNIKLKMLISL